MKKSRVLMNDGSDQLCLSGLLSEWLFSSGFWSDFNARNGTIFDQYEEDDVDGSTAGAVVDAIEKRILLLEMLKDDEIEFIYRWTAEKIPITAHAKRELLISELTGLRDFLAHAVEGGSQITFWL